MDAAAMNHRFLLLSSKIINLCRELKKQRFEGDITRQILRSGTSPGANYQEACAAESRADFIHKLQLVLKELRETKYWLEVIKSNLNSPHLNERIDDIIRSNQELIRIIGKSVVTAKSKIVKQKG